MMILRPQRPRKPHRQPVSASSPTDLSNVLRRISREPQAPAAVPAVTPAIANGLELYGFEEPDATVAELPPEPAPEDIVALLAEQPEVARLGAADPPAKPE